MFYRTIKENIYAVGAVDWDRTLFDALMPLPNGTTYNSYLIRGSKKTALIDTVDPGKFDVLLKNLDRLKVENIDYLISNHAEQDHSGSIPGLMKRYPKAILVTGKKGQDMLLPLLDIPEQRIQIIEDRQSLSLGNKTLQFIFAPWVHWPETMFTYLVEDRILFSCDLFGSHLASSRLVASQNPETMGSAKRYYAEIMMPFAGRIGKHLDALSEFKIEMIAPSHGPIHDHPQDIITAYRDWISEKVKNEVVVLYVSMHGSTESLVHRLVDVLVEKEISVQPFNMVSAGIGEIAVALVDAATVILASPAVLMGPHPAIAYAAYLMNLLKPKTRFVGVMGSFGWASKMVDQINDLIKDLGVEMLPPLLIKGNPTPAHYSQIAEMGDLIKQKHETI